MGKLINFLVLGFGLLREDSTIIGLSTCPAIALAKRRDFLAPNRKICPNQQFDWEFYGLPALAG
jgi:hypothetical protein